MSPQSAAAAVSSPHPSSLFPNPPAPAPFSLYIATPAPPRTRSDHNPIHAFLVVTSKADLCCLFRCRPAKDYRCFVFFVVIPEGNLLLLRLSEGVRNSHL